MKFVSLDTVSFIVSCWLSVSSKSNASGDGTQTFTVPGSALRCKANLQYIAFMNFREQIQFTGTLHCNTCAYCQWKGHPGCLVAHTAVQLRYISPVSKMKSDSVRINADVFAYWIWMCSPRRYIHIQDPFIATLYKFQSIRSREI